MSEISEDEELDNSYRMSCDTLRPELPSRT